VHGGLSTNSSTLPYTRTHRLPETTLGRSGTCTWRRLQLATYSPEANRDQGDSTENFSANSRRFSIPSIPPLADATETGDEVTMHRDLIFDVGLHRGEDTEFYLAKGFRVVAFEADPFLAAAARERFSEVIREGRLEIVEGAISDVEEPTVRFYRNPEVSEWGTVDRDWVHRNEALGSRHEMIDVDVVDFAGEIRKHGVPYYLKIDIEGADRICLSALSESPTRPCYVSVESEKVDFDELISEFRLLEELGYRDFLAVQQADVKRTRLPDASDEGRAIDHSFKDGSSGPFGQDLGGWRSSEEVIDEYRSIFADYRRFGDATIWQRTLPGRALLKAWSLLRGATMPGWYDTHARLGDSEMASTPFEAP
jgi:FkbM family methyltransferase